MIKKIIIAIAVFYSAKTIKEDCNSFYSFSNGTQLEMKSYDDKDKMTGSSRTTLSNVNVSGKTASANAVSEIYDDKGKLLMNSNYTVTCDEGVLLIDMQMMVNPEQQKSFQNMEVKVQSDALDIPSNLQVGQNLKGGILTMSAAAEGGPAILTMTMTISNRKVEAIETITTPAGTYECVKISYDVETKMLFAVKAHAIEWYARGIGLVRSENYNAKNKLMGYSVLTSFKK